MLRSISIRHVSSTFKHHQRCTSSIPTPALNSEKGSDEILGGIQTKVNQDSKETNVKEEVTSNRSNLVKAAFSNLKHNHPQIRSKTNVEEKIKQAITPEELLKISENYLTRGQALKIVSTLSEWSFNGKAVDNNFESDPRFANLCRIVGKNFRSSSSAALRNGDLSVVLEVTGEDEAAKIVGSISLPQMIKVLTTLSNKKRRSLHLLRSLAFNIGRLPLKLDVKQSTDILYALSSLNFPDDVLLEKVCSDLVETLPVCQKSAVFGSVCTSLGLLKYKDTELLDVLCDWALKNKDISRNQDLVALLLCLASVRHLPNQELLAVLSKITEGELPSSSTWLDVVWSLAVLGAASEAQLSSVLNSKFLDKIVSSSSMGSGWKRKLLNLNGAAKLTKGYKGSLLSDDINLDLTMTRTKEKQHLVASILDTLSNLFPSSHYYKSCVDTGMGFLIDAECIVDAAMNPSPLFDKKSGQPIDDNQMLKRNRIAFFIHEYHDCTRGRVELAGPAYFNSHLTSLFGYKVINMLYTDYSTRANLISRVQYVEGLLKASVSETT